MTWSIELLYVLRPMHHEGRHQQQKEIISVAKWNPQGPHFSSQILSKIYLGFWKDAIWKNSRDWYRPLYLDADKDLHMHTLKIIISLFCGNGAS